jgi:type I restriction enzyme S subunit
MAQNALPSEWRHTKLGNIVSYGSTRKCAIADVTDDTWVLELEDVEKESSKILTRKTAKKRPFKSTKNRFAKGDVLYGKLRPYLNKVVVADDSGVCTTEIIPLSAEPFVLNRYLFYWLKTRDYLNYVNDVSYGVNMPRLGTKDGVAAPFVLAPLAEQKVIADKLDTLLAQVENTKARLERIPKILKRFRQSVLAAAVSGRLTEMPNALATEMLTVGQLAVDIRYGTSKKCSESAGSTPVLRIPNIGDGYINQNNLKFADFDEKERAKLALQQGDLLLIRSNGSLDLVGKTALAQDKDIGLLFAGYLIRVRLDKQIADPAYVSLYLRSPETRAIIEEKAKSTSGVNNINSKELASLELSPPSKEVQQEIVRQVDQLFAHADRIEQQVKSALARVNNLTQSILAKAFRGELTEQWRNENQALIGGENSAAALLERIKAERAAMKPVKRTRSKRTTV